jgi:hypothetical protein
MPTYLSDQLYSLQSSTTVGGVAGGPQQIRGAEYRGKLKWRHFTLSNSGAAVPSPSLGGASLAIADVIVLGGAKVIERMVFGRVFFSAWGTSATLSIGKIDPNNSSNTAAAHYKALTSVATAGNWDFDTNIGEQIGADPEGDQSTGNTAPEFGSADIEITATVAGATPASTATLNGYFITSDGS